VRADQLNIALMYLSLSHVDLPVPRGPKRKKLDFGSWKNLFTISIYASFLELMVPKYHQNVLFVKKK